LLSTIVARVCTVVVLSTILVRVCTVVVLSTLWYVFVLLLF
jgi:hypothetical protein